MNFFIIFAEKTKIMKTSRFIVPATVALLCAGFVSCRNLGTESEGSISVRFISVRGGSPVKIPDTEDFLLSITGSNGAVIYSGRFGDAPEEISVPRGSYTVSAVSRTFEEAAFNCPQYGDTQEIVVGSGERVCAELLCSQTNCGITLLPDGSFRDAFPDGVFYLSGDDGTLMYGYGESRTAFFNPGKVDISVSEDGKAQRLFSRTLEAGQMLSVKISASGAEEASGVSIQLDTSRLWISDSYVYGEGWSGDADDAMDILEAREHIGSCGVWVRGYLAGCATGIGKFEFETPFSKETNILLGLRSGTSDGDYCISVELKKESIRSALNLRSNPSLHRGQVYIKGDLVSSYYGIPGLKNVSEYQFR